MTDEQMIAIPAEPAKPVEPENQCWMSISASGISVRWDRALPDGPHKVTRVELMVAAAMIGIASSLTGNGAEAVLDSLLKFDHLTRGRKR